VPEKRRVILSPTAVADLDAVYDPLHARIVKRLHLLSRFPELGSPMGCEFAGWRQSPVVIFRIIYRVTPMPSKSPTSVTARGDCRTQQKNLFEQVAV